MPGPDHPVEWLQTRQHVEEAVRLAKRAGAKVTDVYTLVDEFWEAPGSDAPRPWPRRGGGE